MKPITLISVVLIVGIAILFGWQQRTQARFESEKANRHKWEEAAKQSAQMRATELVQQEKVNEALRKQNDNLAGINAGLARDLAELRNRPERPMPQGAGTACAGASGADLSRRDAGAFVRLAARADRIREALGACYTAYDAVRQSE